MTASDREWCYLYNRRYRFDASQQNSASLKMAGFQGTTPVFLSQQTAVLVVAALFLPDESEV